MDTLGRGGSTLGGGGSTLNTEAGFALGEGARGPEAAAAEAEAAAAPSGPEHNPIFEALMRSQEPFAMFLRQECELTGEAPGGEGGENIH